MMPTYATKAGQRYRYYACATARRSKREGCTQRQVAAVDLERSVHRQLEPVLGHQLSTPVVQESVERITYQGSTRAVRVNLRDGTWSEYSLPAPIRRGLRRNVDAGSGRVPRITRLMALAIRIQALVREGAAGSYRDLAEAGRISPARISQILRLADLAPSIQEELLFLPRVLKGEDPVTEKDLREVARLTDWQSQRERFDALVHSQLARGR